MIVVVVVDTALAVLGPSDRAGRTAGERSGGGLPRTAGTALAAVCLSATGLVVAYGLYLIIA